MSFYAKKNGEPAMKTAQRVAASRASCLKPQGAIFIAPVRARFQTAICGVSDLARSTATRCGHFLASGRLETCIITYNYRS